MSNPQVSVIIPVYNIKEYILRCIESVFNQTFDDWEIIAVDDGSTDGSSAILDELAEKNKKVKVFHVENGGVSNARNFGMEQSDGDYIYFLDGDDWIEPQTLKTLYEFAKRGFDVVQSNHDIVDENGNHKVVCDFSDKEVYSSEQAIGLYFLEEITQSVCNKLFKKEFIKNIKFDTELSIGEDSKVVYEVCKIVKSIKLISSITYHYFTRSNSALNKPLTEKHFAPFKLFDAQAEEQKNNKELYEMCKKRNMGYSFYLIRLALRGDRDRKILKRLRGQIIADRKILLRSKYCLLKHKLGIIIIWIAPWLFYKVF